MSEQINCRCACPPHERECPSCFCMLYVPETGLADLKEIGKQILMLNLPAEARFTLALHLLADAAKDMAWTSIAGKWLVGRQITVTDIIPALKKLSALRPMFIEHDKLFKLLGRKGKRNPLA